MYSLVNLSLELFESGLQSLHWVHCLSSISDKSKLKFELR